MAEPPPSFAPGSGRRPAAPPGAQYAAPPTADGAPPVFSPRPAGPAGAPPSFAPRGAPAATAPPAPAPPRPRRPSAPGGPPSAPPGTPVGASRPRHRRRWIVGTLVVLLVLAVVWPLGLAIWANGKIQRIDGLTLTGGGPGTTYLIAGSDARDGGIADDGTTGSRADTILLLHVPSSGTTSLISLPRDTYVDIPGHGPAKLNAATAYGGASLLVQTVEQLTGLKIDHYVEIGMGGVKDIVDAVGGVELCWDADVNDADSGMVWTAGCHEADGAQALAFSRMRKSDPTGDIGRGLRQRQVVGAVMGKVDPASLVWRPNQQVKLVDAGTAALSVDQGASIVDLGRLAMAFRTANGPDGVTGTPPIKSMDYRPGNVGSTVLLDPDTSPAFWQAVADGTLAPGTVGGVPG